MLALRFASSLAQEADAYLTVLHVMEDGMHEWPDLYDTFMTNTRVSLQEFRKEVNGSAASVSSSLSPRMCGAIAPWPRCSREGKPYREILRAAGDGQSDLIVMGVSGRGALDLMVFGSATQHVVRMAKCPVLTPAARNGFAKSTVMERSQKRRPGEAAHGLDPMTGSDEERVGSGRLNGNSPVRSTRG